MPGTVLVGLGLRALKSAAHCIDAASAHMGGSATTFGLPGIQVKPLLPSRSTTILPRASVSTILAELAISVGPADMARAIFTCAVSFAPSCECCTGRVRVYRPSEFHPGHQHHRSRESGEISISQIHMFLLLVDGSFPCADCGKAGLCLLE